MSRLRPFPARLPSGKERQSLDGVQRRFCVLNGALRRLGDGLSVFSRYVYYVSITELDAELPSVQSACR